MVDAYNERTDLADIEKVIEELIKLKYEIQEELDKGNEYNLSIEEKAFFDALGADPEIKELMKSRKKYGISKSVAQLQLARLKRVLTSYKRVALDVGFAKEDLYRIKIFTKCMKYIKIK